MDIMEIQRVLATLVDYFESGNSESDAAAKNILASSGEFDEYWQAEIERFQRSVEWTGLRGQEAEILATRLRQAAGLIAGEL
jgi:hypothetical protein